MQDQRRQNGTGQKADGRGIKNTLKIRKKNFLQKNLLYAKSAERSLKQLITG